MKRMRITCLCSCFKGSVTLLHAEQLVAILIFSVCLAAGGRISVAHAGFQGEEFAFLYYDENTLQPRWIEGGVFSAILAQDIDARSIDYLAKQTNFVLNNVLNSLKKKIKISFHPKIIVKPFVVVEEIQDLLVIYRSKRQRKDIHIDERFQAKVLIRPSAISHLRKISQRKPFAVSPYYNKIYGLHLQIAW